MNFFLGSEGKHSITQSRGGMSFNRLFKKFIPHPSSISLVYSDKFSDTILSKCSNMSCKIHRRVIPLPFRPIDYTSHCSFGIDQYVSRIQIAMHKNRKIWPQQVVIYPLKPTLFQ